MCELPSWHAPGGTESETGATPEPPSPRSRVAELMAAPMGRQSMLMSACDAILRLGREKESFPPCTSDSDAAAHSPANTCRHDGAGGLGGGGGGSGGCRGD
eukprot:scaffold7601_cov417-Prasinococcus_capsulatus_cf.AAC.4